MLDKTSSSYRIPDTCQLGVRGAPAEIDSGAFPPLNLTSGGNKFNDFAENQMTKFHAEFPNFMQNYYYL